MNVTLLTKAGFAFEGWFPEDYTQLPLDYSRYPNYWCFRVECFGCQLVCQYCYNKPYLGNNEFILEHEIVEQVRQYGSVNTFSYTIGEPGQFISEIENVIQQYPSDQFRHCIKTNGSFTDNNLVEDIHAINTDIKGDSSFYEQWTQQSGFFENVLEPHLQWFSDIIVPEKEITYSVWLWQNDDEDTRQLVLNYIDQSDATLCLNFIRSCEGFNAGYELRLNNSEIHERISQIYEWFKDYGIEPFLCNFRYFDVNQQP